MSLTSFLEKNADVRERFRQEFKKPTFVAKNKLIASPLNPKPINQGTVGTAFDYLLRFLIQQLNPHTNGKRPWIAELVVHKHLASMPDLQAMGRKIVIRARQDLKSFLTEGQISDALIESALMLATLDPIARVPTARIRKACESIGIIQKEDLQDLKNLIYAVDKKTFTTSKLCLVNPTFGSASKLVKGADADLVIDDTLIEIKTVKDLELEREYFDQVLGYYVLHHLGGVGNLEPKPTITKVAIYFSRFGYLHVMPLSEIIVSATFPSFIQWFQERAAKAFNPGGLQANGPQTSSETEAHETEAHETEAQLALRF